MNHELFYLRYKFGQQKDNQTLVPNLAFCLAWKKVDTNFEQLSGVLDWMGSDSTRAAAHTSHMVCLILCNSGSHPNNWRNNYFVEENLERIWPL